MYDNDEEYAVNEKCYTESQVKTILRIYGLDDSEIDELFEYVCFCQISLCKELAEYEGWLEYGLMRRGKVCEGHKHLLRGYKDEKRLNISFIALNGY